MIDVSLHVSMPDADLPLFLQALRGWERARGTIMMRLHVEAPDVATSTIVAMLQELDPPMDYLEVVQKGDIRGASGG